MMTLVLAGGRDFYDAVSVGTILDLYAELQSLEIYVGDCPKGLDYMVREWCWNTGTKCNVFAAEWHKYGKAAGPRRNAEMCKAAIEADPEAILFAFPGGRGTASCIQQARRFGLRVVQIPDRE